MAIPKVMGIENEYGIYVPDNKDEKNYCIIPERIINAAVALFSSFKREERKELLNDFSAEIVGRIEKNLSAEDRDKSYREVLRVLGVSGQVLSNGSRFYIDCGHPEYSTPECFSARDALIWDKAGEKIIELCRRNVEEELKIKIEIHKDNTDAFGNSFGTHECYLTEPKTFEEIVTPGSRKGTQLINFLVARQIICGAGKVGSNHPIFEANYQISQRADFIIKCWGLDTTQNRAIINLRDHPYADPLRFRRLHLILGDANLCEPAEFLKLGLTSVFLKLLEDDFIAKTESFLCQPLYLPTLCLKVVSRDLTFKQPLPFNSGKKTTALEILDETNRLLRLYFETRAPSEEEKEILKLSEFFVEKLKTNFLELFGYSDWVTKYVVLRRLREKTKCKWDSPKAKAIDYLYHNLNPEVGSYFKLDKSGKIKHIVKEEEIIRAVKEAPENTRAYLRGKCIEKFGGKIYNIGWDFVKFRNYWLELPNPIMTRKEAEEILDSLPSLLENSK